MRLGEMLVRDGRIEESALDKVIARQTKEGGRLGSLLVTEQLIDAETLTVYLGLELGIPIATGATFERCKGSAVRLLTPKQAARFCCIPIVIQGQTLTVAIEDPHDMQILDEISQATGYRVIPRVAPEIRIRFYLERFYGVPQPERFAKLTNLRGSTEASDTSLPAPPLPGLPPRVAEPTEPPTPAPPIRTKRRSSNPPPVPSPNDGTVTQAMDHVDTEEHEALELDAADLVEELDADDEAGPSRPIKPRMASEGDTTFETHEPPPDPISAAAALKIISETQKRGSIADAILGHASELFEVATLLLIRDNMAFGWKGFGPGLNQDRIETLLMPFDGASMFRVALKSDHIYRAQAFSCALHTHWFRVLRCKPPEVSIVSVCAIGKRPVNLLYGHSKHGGDLSDEQMAGLSKLMDEAAKAYVRLISKSKQGSQTQTPS